MYFYCCLLYGVTGIVGLIICIYNIVGVFCTWDMRKDETNEYENSVGNQWYIWVVEIYSASLA